MLDLHVACNDPDNGCFAGRAEQLNIGDATFEPTHHRHLPAFRELDGAIRLAGKRWQVSSSKYGVGNWCWNSYLLARPDITPRWYLVEFITWLRDRQLFRCTEAESDFFEWFNGADRLAPADVHELLGRLE